MIFLALNIFASSMMTIIFKISAVKKWDGDHVMLVNYIIAVLISLGSAISGGQLSSFVAVGQADFSTLLTETTPGNSIAISIILGGVLGCVFMLNLLVSKASIAKNGAGLSTFFSKSAFLGGILFSAIIWKETPSSLQWAGAALILAALILMADDVKTLEIGSPTLFPILILGGAIVELIYKAFAEYALPGHKPIFMLIVFFVALLMCVVKNIELTKSSSAAFRLTKQEILLGLCLGTANTSASLFQLKALELFPTSIVFPTQAAGSLLLIYIICAVFFHEPLSKKQLAAVGISVVSLILVNV